MPHNFDTVLNRIFYMPHNFFYMPYNFTKCSCKISLCVSLFLTLPFCTPSKSSNQNFFKLIKRFQTHSILKCVILEFDITIRLCDTYRKQSAHLEVCMNQKIDFLTSCPCEEHVVHDIMTMICMSQ